MAEKPSDLLPLNGKPTDLLTSYQPQLPSPNDPGAIDRDTGASAGVRQAVSAAPNRNDALATLQQWYPDAQPHGSDNFVFTNPETGRQTLYNPEGFDWGDAVSLIPEAFELVGGGIGGAGGAIAGAPGGPGGVLMGYTTGAGAGGAGANALYDFLAPSLFGTHDTRTTRDKVQDTGMDFVMNAAGEGIGRALPNIAGKFTRSLLGGTISQKGQDLAADFARNNIPLNQPGAIGGRTLQMIEMGLNNTPFGGGVIDDAKQVTQDVLADRVGELAGRYRNPTGAPLQPASRLDAGSDIMRAGRDAVDAFSVESKRLYDELDNVLPQGVNTPIGLNNTQGALGDILSSFPSAPELGQALQPKMFETYAAALDGVGSLTWQEIKAFRTAVGGMIGDPVARGDTQLADIKRLYGALSDDMAAAAEAAGPDALAAFQKANAYFRNGVASIEGALADIADPSASPTSVWRSIKQLGTEGTASESLRSLAVIRRKVAPEAWDTYASALLNDLGNATPGAQDVTGEVFSVNTFLTNWNKMSPEARSIIFDGTRYADLDASLQSLTRVIGALKDAGRLSNTSNTALSVNMGRILNTLGVGVGGATGAALSGDLAGFAGGIAGMGGVVLLPREAAKLFTNPRFVSWLAKTPIQQANASVASAANADMMGHIGRLAGIADQEAGISAEIHKLMDYLSAHADREYQARHGQPGRLSQNLTNGMMPPTNGMMPPTFARRLTSDLLNTQ